MSVLLSDGQVVERPVGSGPSLFRLAFRPFFLLGALFSVISILLWAGMFSGLVAVSPFGGALWWHSHEMLFGFVVAIIVGFLLTAVQTWTGSAGIRGWQLSGLVLLWLSARVGLFYPAGLPGWAVTALDLSFLPVAAVVLATPILRIRQWRNSVFVPILLAMTVANAMFHAAVYRGDPGLQGMAGNFMVMLVVLLMTVVAGRVVPMFTANGTGTERVPSLVWLERLSPALMLLAIPAGMSIDVMPDGLAAGLLLLAAGCQGFRVLRWRTWVTLSTPLVWTLHLSYWSIAIGLALLAVAQVTDLLSHSQALHALTVGAIGMMILAMISRVSLGHTGRPLVVGPVMVFAYVALALAALLRVGGPVWLQDYRAVVVGTAALWAMAYGLFVIVYLPILARPRPDGRPG
ncbi:MAG: NnrS family protein [Halioglobus sp.]